MVAKLKPSVLINTNPFLEAMNKERLNHKGYCCLLYTSPSPRDGKVLISYAVFCLKKKKKKKTKKQIKSR